MHVKFCTVCMCKLLFSTRLLHPKSAPLCCPQNSATVPRKNPTSTQQLLTLTSTSPSDQRPPSPTPTPASHLFATSASSLSNQPAFPASASSSSSRSSAAPFSHSPSIGIATPPLPLQPSVGGGASLPRPISDYASVPRGTGGGSFWKGSPVVGLNEAAATPAGESGNLLFVHDRPATPRLTTSTNGKSVATHRRNLFHDLAGAAGGSSSNGAVQRSLMFDLRASDLREPGAFRRHFVLTKQASTGRGGVQDPGAQQQGGMIFTRNFIDLLLLYGFYGDDAVPSDEEEEDIVDEAEARREGDKDDPLLTPRPSTLPWPPSIATVNGTSAKRAFFMLIKAFVGTGVLFLPKAFANGGMLFSIGLMVFLGWLTLHCMLLLVKTSRELGGSFGDIGEYFYGPRMRQLVLASIAISQMGFSCAYYIFVAQNLQNVAQPEKDENVSDQRGPREMLDLSHPRKTAVHQEVQDDEKVVRDLFVPIAESMKRPERLDRVLPLCVLTIGVVFISTGAIGPPRGSPPVMVLQFFYAVAIMLSFPLTVYPSIRITESALFGVRDGKVDAVVKWQKNAFRLVHVGLLAAWGGSERTIWTTLFHYRLSEDWRAKAKDMATVVLGVVAMVYTTWVTVEEWVVGVPDVPRNRCESRGGMW
ncbi:transmembrane amino acid transporter protein-domain-containing protein [Cladochytrium replicatum]|nr:transmembrane amino acid transporter protein-domain-containing protein [Cladochytrium replicatum]